MKRQETYPIGKPMLRTRCYMLRNKGFTVRTCSMGVQVTPIGRIKMTLVNITGPEDLPVPTVGLEHESVNLFRGL